MQSNVPDEREEYDKYKSALAPIGLKENPECSRQISYIAKRAFLNIPYKESGAAKSLDIFLPDEGNGPFPVIIEIHGGGWFFGCKCSKRFAPVFEGIKRGYAAVSLDYTLSSSEKFPVQIEEIKTAVRFLRAHAADYHLDPTHIALWGESAGAHLAVVTGASNGTNFLDGMRFGWTGYSSKVQAVVALCPPIDLAGCHRYAGGKNGARSQEGVLLGGDPQTAEYLVKVADPTTYLDEQASPCFIQMAELDTIVPPEQGRSFEKSYKKKVGRDTVYLEELKGAVHNDPMFRISENRNKIYAFLNRYMKEIRKGEEVF